MHPRSRRQALKALAGLPLLPLLPLPAGLAGCAARSPDRPAALRSVEFTGMAAPGLAEPDAMARPQVGSTMTVHLADGCRRDYRLAYEAFFVTGDAVPDGRGGTILAGGYLDIQGRPIVDRSVPGRERQFFSDCPDGTSLLSIQGARAPGVKGNTVFAVVQFEYNSRNQAGRSTWAMLPSPVAVLTLDQNPDTGRLRLVRYHPVDTAPAHALWITCGASLSPWNTHLSSEEYEPDAPFAAESPEFRAFSLHTFGDADAANPYHYGHLPEITVHPDGTGSVRKHYCLGRISHELVQVMPDRRTLLMGDDTTNGGLFVFVADCEADLSAGTLYVARLGPGFSLDPQAAGAPLQWIRLGHATSAEIEALTALKPADIMEVRRTDPHHPGFTRVFVDGQANWVRLKPGMEKAAAFLETHRYAGLVGASMGFTKLEGTTVNARDKVAYSALQNIDKSMVRGHPAWRDSHNITVDRAVRSGAVLAHTLGGGLQDTSGRPIDSEWMPQRTRTLLVGRDMPADALGNTADPDRIASPDNLKFSEKMRTLFIGEDSDQHVNNFVWAYQVDTGTLARLASMPCGAECTGLHAVDEIGGWTYVMSNFQHAGDWAAVHGRVRPAVAPLIDARYRQRAGASAGYLTAERIQPRLE